MGISTGAVKRILEEAFGKELVQNDNFKVEAGGEEIKYWEFTKVYTQSNGNTYFLDREDKDARHKLLKSLNDCKDSKAFLFFSMEDYPSVVFSLEIVEYTNTFQSLNSTEEIKNAVEGSKDIVRLKCNSGNLFTVIIKVGEEGKRDYTALKHYIESSDNRTYNKVVRNMVEYITVNVQQSIPENKSPLPHNLLVSGAPGTGKSHYLKSEVLKAGQGIIEKAVNETPYFACSDEEKKATAEKNYSDRYVMRVTFYEDYAYENFVGCYKPVPAQSTAEVSYAGKNGTISEEKITYTFVCGPFIDTYIKAKNDAEHSYFLIVEEINRAKAASVFGDMFQLLDRKNGVSEYEIKPDTALNEYLATRVNNYDGFMKLPSNMYIWATMNSADQGVLPLDSAFKRRWSQIYMDINSGNGNGNGYPLCLPKKDGSMGKVSWENLRSKINDIILKCGFDEDRCIGTWYFTNEELARINAYYELSREERRNAINPLIDKLLYYLRQDVFRRNPKLMFQTNDGEDGGITMSDIRRRIRENETIETILNISALPWEKIENENEMNNAQS